MHFPDLTGYLSNLNSRKPISMYYLLDIHHKPPCVVLVSPDISHVEALGQNYANQVGRSLVVATGDAPDDPAIRPILPNQEPVTPPGVTGLELGPVIGPATPLEVGGLDDVWNLLRKLEPTAVQLLIQVLQALSTKR